MEHDDVKMPESILNIEKIHTPDRLRVLGSIKNSCMGIGINISRYNRFKDGAADIFDL